MGNTHVAPKNAAKVAGELMRTALVHAVDMRIFGRSARNATEREERRRHLAILLERSEKRINLLLAGKRPLLAVHLRRLEPLIGRKKARALASDEAKTETRGRKTTPEGARRALRCVRRLAEKAGADALVKEIEKFETSVADTPPDSRQLPMFEPSSERG